MLDSCWIGMVYPLGFFREQILLQMSPMSIMTINVATATQLAKMMKEGLSISCIKSEGGLSIFSTSEA